MNIVPRNGSNTTQGSFFVSGTGAKLQSDNLTPALRAQGVTASYSAHQGLRCVGCDRRPDREGPRLVLRQRARRRQHDEEPERLLQPECRRSEQLVVCPGSRTAVLLRPDLRECQRPCHVAGDAAPQGQRLLGCAGLVPDVYGRHAHQRGTRTSVAGSRGRAWPATGRVAGDMVVAHHESPAPGRGFWRHCVWLRQRRAGSEPHARSDPRRGAVREGLRRERQHSRAGLPIAGLQHFSHGLVPLEGLTRVRDRLAQPEDGISAHADDGRPDCT